MTRPMGRTDGAFWSIASGPGACRRTGFGSIPGTRRQPPVRGLRKWFNHEPEKWDAFRDRYFRELDQQPEVVAKLIADCGEGTVTLVFGATETRYNNAVALKAYLERRGPACPASTKFGLGRG